jgi:HK97 family phage prohead protease
MRETRQFSFAVRAVADDGVFSGYGSVFDVVYDVSGYGDKEMVAPGAFKKSLAELNAAGRKLPILWQHRAEEPIGSWREVREDDHGLYVEGGLWLDDAHYARLAQRGMRDKAVTGLSIGFYPDRWAYDEKAGVTILEEVKLVEVSVVNVPANDDARVDQVRMRLARGEKPTIREFEKSLRERGFSRAEAEEIASDGFRFWARREAQPKATSNEMGALVSRLRNFTLPTF